MISVRKLLLQFMHHNRVSNMPSDVKLQEREKLRILPR
jgi:hypothetical protein